MKTIEPKQFKKLDNPDKILEFLKKVGAEKEDRKNPRKKYIYKGLYTDKTKECKIIGYNGDYEVVIKLESDNLHCIHPSFLIEMQSSKFGLE